MTTDVVEETVSSTSKNTPKRQAMARDERELKWPSLKTLAAPQSKACEDAWVAAFTLKPEAMYRLLQDLIKQAYAAPGRIGQRPMPKEEEVDLQALLYGEYAEEPLVDILPKLMNVSERAFCQRVFMSRTKFQRMMRGDYQPDMHEVRMIAAAIRKPPAFFIEYRVMAAQAAFMQMLAQRPNIATKLYRSYLEVRSPGKAVNRTAV